ncbi:hypothetical protein [Chryseobacterium koreense]
MIGEKKLTSIRLNGDLFKTLQKRADEETPAAMDEAINRPEKPEQTTDIDAFLKNYHQFNFR